jgi:hypothetical protein
MTIKWDSRVWEDGREGRRGEKRNKLTPEQVQEIRSRGGKRNNAKLARKFGISPSQVCNIVGGKQWKSIEP